MSQQNIQAQSYNIAILLAIFCTGGWPFGIAGILLEYIIMPFLWKRLRKHPIIFSLLEVFLLTVFIIIAAMIKIL